MINLKGHAALITGSSRGIGRSIAEAFADAGADVLIHGLQPSDESKAAIAYCVSKGVKAAYIGADLSAAAPAATDELFRNAIALMPHLDILVNNAGQYFDVPFLEMTGDRFDKTMRLNVATPYFLTQAFARHWIASKVQGRVLMIGSINGQLAEEDSTGYDTSKGALLMMMKTLAANLAGKGVRVNGLAPGLVRTPQTSWIDRRPDDAAWVAHHTPDKQVPHCNVCGSGAVYLCSDAAEHVHGQMLLVDGGMSVWQQPSRGPWKQG